jgi:hypothetical protein
MFALAPKQMEFVEEKERLGVGYTITFEITVFAEGQPREL